MTRTSKDSVDATHKNQYHDTQNTQNRPANTITQLQYDTNTRLPKQIQRGDERKELASKQVPAKGNGGKKYV